MREFQSLLCWIMVCKSKRIMDSEIEATFQSLLCWIMVCKTWLDGSSSSFRSVSILVMLDYGL